jgi:OmpA-OmpF porin, OOP family
MKIQRLVCVAALAAGVACLAQAQEVYVGGSFGASSWSIVNAPGASVDGDDVGYKVVFGSQLNPYLAVEIGWADLGKAKLTGAGVSGDLTGKGGFIDLVGMLQTSKDWWLLGRIGAFNGEVKGQVSGVGSDTDRGTNVKYGLGAQFDISRTTMLRAEWERYRFDHFGDNADVDLWSVGVNFSF